MAQFISGLKDDMKADVRVLGALNLDHAMELAVNVEEKLRRCAGRKVSVSNSLPFLCTPVIHIHLILNLSQVFHVPIAVRRLFIPIHHPPILALR